MKKIFSWLVFLGLTSCCTNPEFTSDFCTVGPDNLVCSEKQPNGDYLEIDRAFSELQKATNPDGSPKFESWILIPPEDFEVRFGQK